jgi:hypothetical protein
VRTTQKSNEHAASDVTEQVVNDIFSGSTRVRRGLLFGGLDFWSSQVVGVTWTREFLSDLSGQTLTSYVH